MGDRRQGDRREPEEGIIKVKTKNIIGYSVLLAILVMSIICNVVLGVKNAKLKEDYEDLLDNYYEDYYGYEEDYDEEYEADLDEDYETNIKE